MKGPVVSVLIPTYNQGQFIGRSIKSVLEQTYSDFEIIILDNCSTDETAAEVSSFLYDDRIRYIKNENNIGRIANFNKAMSLANGKYIKFLFSDDLLINNCLERFVAVFNSHPSLVLATSYFNYVGDMNYTFRQDYTGLISGEKVLRLTLAENWIGAPSNVMFKTSSIGNSVFSDQWAWWTDLVFWHELIIKGDVFIIPEILSEFTYHKISATSSILENYVNLHDEYYYLRQIEKQNLFPPLKLEAQFKFQQRKAGKAFVRRFPNYIVNRDFTRCFNCFIIVARENLIWFALKSFFSMEKKWLKRKLLLDKK